MAPTPGDHPAEYLHAARDSLLAAQSLKQRHDFEARVEDYAAYGSAITSVLDALNAFTAELCGDIENVDRASIQQQAHRDQPDIELDEARQQVEQLREILTTALTHAGHYWAKAEHVYDDTHRHDH